MSLPAFSAPRARSDEAVNAYARRALASAPASSEAAPAAYHHRTGAAAKTSSSAAVPSLPAVGRNPYTMAHAATARTHSPPSSKPQPAPPVTARSSAVRPTTETLPSATARHDARREGLWDVRERAIQQLLSEARTVRPAPPQQPRSGTGRPHTPTTLDDATTPASQPRRRNLPPHLAPTAPTTSAEEHAKHRTKAILKRVAKITDPMELITEEVSLRELVLSNELRHRNTIVMHRMRESLRRAERHSLACEEEQARAAVTSLEQQLYDVLVADPLSLIVEEATSRNAIERTALPLERHVHIANMRFTTNSHLLWRAVQQIRLLDQQIEAIVREEMLDRMYEEHYAIVNLRSAFATARRVMRNHELHLSDERTERLVLETAELGARDAFAAVALEKHQALVLSAMMESRHIRWTDVQHAEGVTRRDTERDERAQWHRMMLDEAAGRRAVHAVLADKRLNRAEKRQRQDVEDYEAASWRTIALSFNLDWNEMWKRLEMARGPRQEVAKYESFARVDLHTAERAAFAEIVQKEIAKRAAIAASQSWITTLYQEHIDGRLAVAHMERKARDAIARDCDTSLIRAMRFQSIEPAVTELMRLEYYARGEIEFAAYCFFVTLLLDKELRRCEVAESTERLHLASACDAEFAALHARAKNEANLKTLLNDHGPRRLLARMEEAEVEHRDELEAVERQVRTNVVIAGYTSYYTARDALNAALRDASGARREWLDEGRERQAITDARADGLRELARKCLGSEQEVVRRDIVASEFEQRLCVYAALVEFAEELARWDFEWLAGDTFWQFYEDMCGDAEERERGMLERTEAEHRSIILGMRNAPLPKNIWLGSLEGDEQAIRENVVFEAEVAANALLRYMKFLYREFLVPDVGDNEVFIYHDDASVMAARIEYFLGEKSLAERIGELMGVMVEMDEPESRSLVHRAQAERHAALTATVEEAIDRQKIVEFEQEQRQFAGEAYRRIVGHQKAYEIDVRSLPLRERERLEREQTWMDARAEMLALLEMREAGATKLDRRVQQLELVDHEAAARQDTVFEEDALWRALVLRSLEGAIGIAQSAQEKDLRARERYDAIGVELSEGSAEPPLVEFAPLADASLRLTIAPERAADADDDAPPPVPSNDGPLADASPTDKKYVVTIRPRYPFDSAEDLVTQQFRVLDAGDGFAFIAPRAHPDYVLRVHNRTAQVEVVSRSSGQGSVFELRALRDQANASDPMSPVVLSPNARRNKKSIGAAHETFLSKTAGQRIALVLPPDVQTFDMSPMASVANAQLGSTASSAPQGAPPVFVVADDAAAVLPLMLNPAGKIATRCGSLIVPVRDADYAARADREVAERRAAIDDAVGAALDAWQRAHANEPAVQDDEFVLREHAFEFIPTSSPEERLSLVEKDDRMYLEFRPKRSALATTTGSSDGGAFGASGRSDALGASQSSVGSHATTGARSTAHAAKYRHGHVVTQSFKLHPVPLGFVSLHPVIAETTSAAFGTALGIGDASSNAIAPTHASENNPRLHWTFAPDSSSSITAMAGSFRLVPKTLQQRAVSIEGELVGDVEDGAVLTLVTQKQSDEDFQASANRNRRLAVCERVLVGINNDDLVEVIPHGSDDAAQQDDRLRVQDNGSYTCALRSGNTHERHHVHVREDGYVTLASVSAGGKLMTFAPGVKSDNEDDSRPDTVTTELPHSDADGAKAHTQHWELVEAGIGACCFMPRCREDTYMSHDGRLAATRDSYRFMLHSVAAAAAAEKESVALRRELCAAVLPDEDEDVEIYPISLPRRRLATRDGANAAPTLADRSGNEEQVFRFIRRPTGAIRVENVRQRALLKWNSENPALVSFVDPRDADSTLGLDWTLVEVEPATDDASAVLKLVPLKSVAQKITTADHALAVQDDNDNAAAATPLDAFRVMRKSTADDMYRLEAEATARSVAAKPLLAQADGATTDGARPARASRAIELAAANTRGQRLTASKDDEGKAHVRVAARLLDPSKVDIHGFVAAEQKNGYITLESLEHRGTYLAAPSDADAKPFEVQAIPCEASEPCAWWGATASPNGDPNLIALHPLTREGLVMSHTGTLIDDDDAKKRPYFCVVGKAAADHTAAIEAARTERLRACNTILPEEDAIVELTPALNRANRVARVPGQGRSLASGKRTGGVAEQFRVRAAADGYVELIAVNDDAVLCATGARTTGFVPRAEAEQSADVAASRLWTLQAYKPVAALDKDELNRAAEDDKVAGSQKAFALVAAPRGTDGALLPIHAAGTEPMTLTDSGALMSSDSAQPRHSLFVLSDKVAADAEARRQARVAAVKSLPVTENMVVEICPAAGPSEMRRVVASVQRDDDGVVSAEAGVDVGELGAGDRLGVAREQFYVKPVLPEGYVRFVSLDRGEENPKAPHGDDIVVAAAADEDEPCVLQRAGSTAAQLQAQHWEVRPSDTDKTAFAFASRTHPGSCISINGRMRTGEPDLFKLVRKSEADAAAARAAELTARQDHLQRVISHLADPAAPVELAVAFEALRDTHRLRADPRAGIAERTGGPEQAFVLRIVGEGYIALECADTQAALTAPTIDGAVDFVPPEVKDSTEPPALAAQWAIAEWRDDDAAFSLQPRAFPSRRLHANASELVENTRANVADVGGYVFVDKATADAEAASKAARASRVAAAEAVFRAVPEGREVEFACGDGDVESARLGVDQDANEITTAPRATDTGARRFYLAREGADDGYVQVRLSGSRRPLKVVPGVDGAAATIAAGPLSEDGTDTPCLWYFQLLNPDADNDEDAAGRSRQFVLRSVADPSLVIDPETLSLAAVGTPTAANAVRMVDSAVADDEEASRGIVRDRALKRDAVLPSYEGLFVEIYPSNDDTVRFSRVPDPDAKPAATDDACTDRLDLASRYGGPGQRFRLLPLEKGFCSLVNAQDERAVAVGTDGALTFVAKDADDTAQQFVLEGEVADFTLRPRDSDRPAPERLEHIAYVSAAAADRDARRKQRRADRAALAKDAESAVGKPIELRVAEVGGQRMQCTPETGAVAMASRRGPDTITAVLRKTDAGDFFAIEVQEPTTGYLSKTPSGDLWVSNEAALNPDDDTTDSEADASSAAKTAQHWVVAKGDAEGTFVLRPRHDAKQSVTAAGKVAAPSRPTSWQLQSSDDAAAEDRRSRVARTLAPALLASNAPVHVLVDAAGMPRQLTAPPVAATNTSAHVVDAAGVDPHTTDLLITLQPRGYVTVAHADDGKVLTYTGPNSTPQYRFPKKDDTELWELVPNDEKAFKPVGDDDSVSADAAPQPLRFRSVADPEQVLTASGATAAEFLVPTVGAAEKNAAFLVWPKAEAVSLVNDTLARMQRLEAAEYVMQGAKPNEVVVMEIEPRPRRRRWKPDAGGARLACADGLTLDVQPERRRDESERFNVSYDDNGFVTIAPVTAAATNKVLGLPGVTASEADLVPRGDGELHCVWHCEAPTGEPRPDDGEVVLCNGSGDRALTHSMAVVPIEETQRATSTWFMYPVDVVDRWEQEREAKLAREAEEARLKALRRENAERAAAMGPIVVSFGAPDADGTQRIIVAADGTLKLVPASSRGDVDDAEVVVQRVVKEGAGEDDDDGFVRLTMPKRGRRLVVRGDKLVAEPDDGQPALGDESEPQIDLSEFILEMSPKAEGDDEDDPTRHMTLRPRCRPDAVISPDLQVVPEANLRSGASDATSAVPPAVTCYATPRPAVERRDARAAVEESDEAPQRQAVADDEAAAFAALQEDEKAGLAAARAAEQSRMGEAEHARADLEAAEQTARAAITDDEVAAFTALEEDEKAGRAAARDAELARMGEAEQAAAAARADLEADEQTARTAAGDDEAAAFATLEDDEKAAYAAARDAERARMGEEEQAAAAARDEAEANEATARTAIGDEEAGAWKDLDAEADASRDAARAAERARMDEGEAAAAMARDDLEGEERDARDALDVEEADQFKALEQEAADGLAALEKGEAEVRRQTVENLYGALDTPEVVEFLPTASTAPTDRVTTALRIQQRDDECSDETNPQAFALADASDGYVLILPWSAPNTALARTAFGGLHFADRDAADEEQHWELIETEDGAFSLAPRTAPELVEAVLDTEEREMRLVPEVDASTFCEFRFVLKSAADADADEARLRREQQEKDEAAADARRAVVAGIVGDIDDMPVYQAIPHLATKMRLAISGNQDTLALEPKMGGEQQQFCLNDWGDGYVQILPWATPDSAVALTFVDGKPKIEIRDADITDPAQAVELLDAQNKLCALKFKDTECYIEAQLETTEGAVGVSDELTNFCVFGLAGVDSMSMSRSRPQSGSSRPGTAELAKFNRERRIAAIAELGGPFDDVREFELVPAEYDDIALTFDREVKPGALTIQFMERTKREDQRVLLSDLGCDDGGYVAFTPQIAPRKALSVANMDASQRVVSADFTITEINVEDYQGFELLPIEKTNTFYMTPKSCPGFYVTLVLPDPEDSAEGAAVPTSWELGLVRTAHATDAAIFRLATPLQPETLEDLASPRSRSRQREAIAEREERFATIVPNPDDMVQYEIAWAKQPRRRLTSHEEHAIVLGATRTAAESQRFVFAPVLDGYFNLVPWTHQQGVVAVKEDLKQLRLLPTAEETSPLQRFEIIMVDKDTGTFMLGVAHGYVLTVVPNGDDEVALSVVLESNADDNAHLRALTFEEAELVEIQLEDDRIALGREEDDARDTLELEVDDAFDEFFRDELGSRTAVDRAVRQRVAGSVLPALDTPGASWTCELRPKLDGERVCSVNKDGQLCAGGARRGVPEERATLTLDEGGYVRVVFRDVDLAVACGENIDDGLTLVTASEYDDDPPVEQLFEVIAASSGAFALEPRMHRGNVAEISFDESAATMKLQPWQGASDLCLLCAVPLDEADAVAKQREEEAAADRRRGVVRKCLGNIQADDAVELHTTDAEDGSTRCLMFDLPSRTTNVGIRLELPPAQDNIQSFVVLDAGEGYVFIVPYGDLEKAVTADRDLRVLRLETRDPKAHAQHWEMQETADGFTLVPRIGRDLLVEAPLDMTPMKQPVRLVSDQDASSFCAFRAVTKEEADGKAMGRMSEHLHRRESKVRLDIEEEWQLGYDEIDAAATAAATAALENASAAAEAAAAAAAQARERTAALDRIYGNNQDVIEFVPPSDEEDRITFSEDKTRLYIAKRDDEVAEDQGFNRQAFTLADLGEGYVAICPWSSENDCWTADVEASTLSLQPREAGNDNQAFALREEDDEGFQLALKGRDILIEAIMDAPDPDARFLRLVTAQEARYADWAMITADDANATAKERREKNRRAKANEEARLLRIATIERLYGSLEEVEVIEIAPSATTKDRVTFAADKASFAIEARDDEAAVSETDNRQAFAFIDALDGYVHVIPWANTDEALTVDVEAGTITLAPRESSPTDTQCFELVETEDKKFSIACKDKNKLIEATLDTDTKALRLVNDDDASTFCEFVLITKSEADAEGAKRRRKIQMERDALEARLKAMATVVPNIDDMPTWEIMPHAALMKRLTTAETDDAVSVLDRVGGERQQFVFNDAGEGYVSIVPWSDPSLGLAFEASENPDPSDPRTAGKFIVTTGAIDAHTQHFALELTEEARFYISPRTAPELYVEAKLDEDGGMCVTSELSNFCEFVAAMAAASSMASSSRPSSSKEMRDRGREARIAAILNFIGDLDDMTEFEVVCHVSTDLVATLPSEGVPSHVATRTGSDTQRVIFTDFGGDDGYVSVVPWSDPQAALTVSEDGTTFTVERASDIDRQAFEVVPIEGNATFSLSPKSHASYMIEAQLDDEDNKRLRLVAEAEASNFCEFTLQKDPGGISMGDASFNASMRSPSKKDKQRKAAFQKFMPNPDDLLTYEIHSKVKEFFAVAVTPSGMLVRQREGTSTEQFIVQDLGDGWLGLVCMDDTERAVTASADGSTITLEAKNDDSDHQVFEFVELSDTAFTFGCKALKGKVIEARLDSDPYSLRFIEQTDATNFCEFGLLTTEDAAEQTQHLTLQRTKSTTGDEKKRNKARKRRRAQAKAVFGDLIDGVSAFAFTSTAVTELAVNFTPNAEATTVGTFVASDDQAFRCTVIEVSEGYIQIQAMSASIDGSRPMVLGVIADGTDRVTVQGHIDEDADPDGAFRQHFEVTPTDDGFSLASRSHEGYVVEATLDDDPVVLRLIPEDEATNFCEFAPKSLSE